MSDELKPCPFCGNTEISTGRSIFGGMHTFSCDRCKLSVEFLWQDREKCIETWNKRYTDD